MAVRLARREAESVELSVERGRVERGQRCLDEVPARVVERSDWHTARSTEVSIEPIARDALNVLSEWEPEDLVP